jgi:GNAT superfamily N-acetyltransferase
MPRISIEELERCRERLITDRTQETANGWSSHIPQMPDELHGLLTAGFPYQSYVELAINETGQGRLLFQIKDGAEDIGVAERTFDIPARIADNSYFTIYQEEYRGRGIAKRLIRNTFSVYQSWGIEQVRVRAALDNGGYVWAKYGFKVSEEEWENLRPTLLNNLWSLYLPNDQVDLATGIIHSDDPNALWDLSDLTYRVDGTKLSRRLLEGTAWSGIFDFNDAECIKRLRERLTS